MLIPPHGSNNKSYMTSIPNDRQNAIYRIAFNILKSNLKTLLFLLLVTTMINVLESAMEQLDTSYC